jgi:hypothetical protein
VASDQQVKVSADMGTGQMEWLIDGSMSAYALYGATQLVPLPACNEGFLRPRVARAQKILRLHSRLCSWSTGPIGGLTPPSALLPQTVLLPNAQASSQRPRLP